MTGHASPAFRFHGTALFLTKLIKKEMREAAVTALLVSAFRNWGSVVSAPRRNTDGSTNGAGRLCAFQHRIRTVSERFAWHVYQFLTFACSFRLMRRMLMRRMEQ
jgi:hypothetical protein